ncbi:MAG: hypothetical protein ACXWV2_03015 [Chitinophagaceae bacterium]
MKKLLILLVAGIFISACNNSADSETTYDSTNYQENKDRNNRNTTVYDSAAGKQGGDTASYEGMPNKVSDSTSR